MGIFVKNFTHTYNPFSYFSPYYIIILHCLPTTFFFLPLDYKNEHNLLICVFLNLAYFI